MVGVVQDISRRMEREARIQHLAYYDPLTGLPNCALLNDRLQQAVAEGVETAEQLQFLRRHHCDAYQGFYLADPLPPEELTQMLLATRTRRVARIDRPGLPRVRGCGTIRRSFQTVRSSIVTHRIVVSAAVLLFAAAPAPAADDSGDGGGRAASGTAAGRIGYVDMQRVVTESAAGKRARAEVEGVAKQKQEQVDRERRKLQAQQQALEKEQLTLTETQRRTKQRDFERKLQAFQQLAAEAQREIGQKGAEHERKVLTDVRAVIREIAQQEKLLMVFEKNAQPVLYAADGPDLTDRVIKAYDARAKN